MKKYIGIKAETVDSKGNLGDVWIEQPSGMYRCEEKKVTLSGWAIQQDLKNGFLKEWIDENSNTVQK